MKVYQVVKSYFDGDHDHGMYRSPLFLNREDAEDFLAQVDATNDRVPDETGWFSSSGWEQYPPYINELEIVETKITAKDSDSYLTITYT